MTPMSKKKTPARTENATGESAELTVPLKLLREGVLIGLFTTVAFLMLSLVSYSDKDPGWSRTGDGSSIDNAGGPAGAWLADVFFSLFGHLAYLFPILLVVQIRQQLKDRNEWNLDFLMLGIRSVGLILVMVASTGIIVLKLGEQSPLLPFSVGGMLGLKTSAAVMSTFGYVGGVVLLLAALLFGLTIFVDISWFAVMDSIGARVLKLKVYLADRTRNWKAARLEKKQAQTAVEERRIVVAKDKIISKKKKPPEIVRMRQEPTISARAVAEKQHSLFDEAPLPGGLPAIALLDPADTKGLDGYSEESLEAMSRLLEIKLKDFGVIAEVTGVLPGPVVTRFELQPAAGVKASKISNLARDLARSLAVSSVRVVEVIEGKSVVGVEIPNEVREMVRLSTIIASELFEKSKSPLTLALGSDISGEPVIADIAKMPHLLVAGTTGSGKSVGVNSMLVSMLYKSTPEEVRLILVDPKMLELSVYDGIPHLLTPVITDMKDAATGLRWCVGEMERRYRLMATMGVRNLAGYNKKIRDAAKAGEQIRDPLFVPDPMDAGLDGVIPEAPMLTTLPFIVVVIDEFADMIMIVGKKVEQLIARIAQKARAAGIHLILATQRPSVDVITGLIKANVPTRMAFQVSSRIDSRTILDQGGAEQLLGHGDMLFLPPGTAHTLRVHGAFIDDHEVHKVVADWKRRGGPNYCEDIFSEAVENIPVPGFSNGDEDNDDKADKLLDEVIEFVTETRKASISSVQRKFRIGYNRAARIVEELEVSGVVSEMGANGNREVLAPAPRR
ncbi:MAG: S-DNA-T family DNA segregation ATPase FtsK/SpoIIIE [Flavobacteriales bacterium]|jgi:S-DNA-T family DNA segregation ATPase FtsK/SpoIIIE